MEILGHAVGKIHTYYIKGQSSLLHLNFSIIMTTGLLLVCSLGVSSPSDEYWTVLTQRHDDDAAAAHSFALALSSAPAPDYT